jgi:type I restriction enzyme, R subunit
VWSYFGDLVSVYDLNQAINDGIAQSVGVENRIIEVSTDNHFIDQINDSDSDLFKSFERSIVREEFITKLAQDITQHFRLRQKLWRGKGVVVVRDIQMGVALSQFIRQIKVSDDGEEVLDGSVETISTHLSATTRAILLERFRKELDSCIFRNEGESSGNRRYLLFGE